MSLALPSARCRHRSNERNASSASGPSVRQSGSSDAMASSRACRSARPRGSLVGRRGRRDSPSRSTGLSLRENPANNDRTPSSHVRKRLAVAGCPRVFRYTSMVPGSEKSTIARSSDEPSTTRSRPKGLLGVGPGDDDCEESSLVDRLSESSSGCGTICSYARKSSASVTTPSSHTRSRQTRPSISCTLEVHTTWRRAFASENSW